LALSVSALTRIKLKKVKFEQLPPILMLVTVNWLKTIAVVGLLGLWLAATNHCRLEQIPALSFLPCCEKGGSSQDDDCQTDGCASVEDGLYKTENNQVQVVTPVFALIPFLVLPGQNAAPGLESVREALPNLAPPELPKSWQFSFRAAAPPRAPALVS
jgi:hypothetical protein